MRTFFKSGRATFLIWTLLSLMTLIPIWWMFLVSVKRRVDLFGAPSFLLDFDRITWDNYLSVISNPTFQKYMVNSLLVASSNAVLVTMLGLLAAYAMSRYKLIGKDNIFFWVLTNRMAPPAVFLLPLFLLYTKIFVIGDIIWPHLLTTAIGHASICAESIDHYLNKDELGRRPKVEGHHFSLLNKLREWGMGTEEYSHEEVWGTDDAKFAVHNYEDRSRHEIISHEKLFLGHFEFAARNLRKESHITADEVLGHFEERFSGMTDEMAHNEAERCMSCGMCFECDNCVIYCPQDAVLRTPKEESTMGRYVYTDYDRCIGCHICAEVCPTGYIDMAMQ